MNVYWNPETRCGIASDGDYAVWFIVPIAVNPVFWAEQVFSLKTHIHTPHAICKLIEIQPLTRALVPASHRTRSRPVDDNAMASLDGPPPAISPLNVPPGNTDTPEVNPIPSVEKPHARRLSFGQSLPYGGKY